MRAAAALALAAALVLAAPAAAAGGWAVTLLDALPAPLMPGVTYDIGFRVLQHGERPADLAGVAVAASLPDGRSLRSDARREGPGRYAAPVTFPVAGRWTWWVEQGPFGPYPLGEVTVGAGTAGAPGSTAAAAAAGGPAAPLHDPRGPLLAAAGLLALAAAAALAGDRAARAVAGARA